MVRNTAGANAPSVAELTLGLIVGLVRGLVFEVLSLLGWVVAYVAAQAVGATVAPRTVENCAGSVRRIIASVSPCPL